MMYISRILLLVLACCADAAGSIATAACRVSLLLPASTLLNREAECNVMAERASLVYLREETQGGFQCDADENDLLHSRISINIW